MHFAPGAKAHALLGKRLSQGDYRALMGMRDMGQFVDYLRSHTAYRTVLGSSERIVHRNQVELRMRKTLYEHYEKFFHYYRDAYRDFFKILFMRYQVENIKLFVRGILRGETFNAGEDHLIRSKVYLAMDYDLMARAGTLQELVKALEGTPYHDLIQIYLSQETKEQLFFIEMSLDGFYFKSLGRAIQGLGRTDAALMGELLGRNVDLMNLQWIYRAKKYYGLSPEVILNYTLRQGRRFKYKELKTLSYLSSPAEVGEAMAVSDYRSLLSGGELYLQRNLQRYIYRLMEELLRRGRGTLMVPVAYLHFLEYEIQDLNSIMESIKYGVGEPGVYLIREFEERGWGFGH
ncbi:MAG: hypothetical protein AVO33_07515 [delta proteobacterium ML8_F1]|nr:MAG: hypothetical protein AVO33_07515 [delta proteobacterium ML8_F1]